MPTAIYEALSEKEKHQVGMYGCCVEARQKLEREIMKRITDFNEWARAFISAADPDLPKDAVHEMFLQMMRIENSVAVVQGYWEKGMSPNDAVLEHAKRFEEAMLQENANIHNAGKVYTPAEVHELAYKVNSSPLQVRGNRTIH